MDLHICEESHRTSYLDRILLVMPSLMNPTGDVNRARTGHDYKLSILVKANEIWP